MQNTNILHENAGLRLLRLPDVQAVVGLRHSTIYKMVSAGTFPKPLRISGRNVAWRSDEVRDWILSRSRV